jgi:hypothetical protein
MWGSFNLTPTIKVGIGSWDRQKLSETAAKNNHSLYQCMKCPFRPVPGQGIGPFPAFSKIRHLSRTFEVTFSNDKTTLVHISPITRHLCSRVKTIPVELEDSIAILPNLRNNNCYPFRLLCRQHPHRSQHISSTSFHSDPLSNYTSATLLECP